MLTLVGKVDRTALVPFDSIEIQSTAGDPLSTAKFTLYDEGSQINISALQEVIIIDENVALTPSETIPLPFSDSFASNDSSNYTSTHGTGGSPASWAFGTGTLTASGGSEAIYLVNSWTAQSVALSATMTRSDFGGLAFNIVDSGDYYELVICDGISPGGAPSTYIPRAFGSTIVMQRGTAQLYKVSGGVRSALSSAATINFIRGTSHTIAVTSTNSAGVTSISVSVDGNAVLSYIDSSGLGIGQAGLRNDTSGGASTAIYTALSVQSLDQMSLVASVPTHNYLKNNNFNFGSGGWTESGGLTGRITFPSTGTYGTGAVATLSFANQAVGIDQRYQTLTNALSPETDYAVPGQQYCFSATVNVTASFINSYAFLQITFLDSTGTPLSSTSSTPITSSSGAQRFNVQATAPANTFQVRAVFGGATTSTTNSGTATFTALQLEPMWFTDPTSPYVASYPTPICDFLQPDSVTLPDSTASRYNRIFTGSVVTWDVTYDGPNRTFTIQANSAEWLLENAALINATYNSMSDQSVITSIVNSMSPRIIFAATPSLAAGTPQALAYRNVPVVYSGVATPTINFAFADNTIREVLNALSSLSGFLFGVDSYYNVWYAPPYFTLAPYALSDNPDFVASWPYYDYKISYDATQMQSITNVLGATISVSTTESWHLQDGSHTEGVQGGKTVYVYLFEQPNAVPATVNIGGTNISCGWDNGTGYGTALSIVSSKNFGVPNLLSFVAPGYAAGTAISVTYTYDVVIYVQVQSPDSIGQYGRALYSATNDTSLGSIAAAAAQGEAQLQTYSQPRPTLAFKTEVPLFPGQVIPFTSSRDDLSAQHFTVQKVTARALGAGLNEYEIQAGTYLDDFVDFFRNTQKAVNSASHSPTEPFKQYNNLQQDTLTISDSLNIHT